MSTLLLLAASGAAGHALGRVHTWLKVARQVMGTTRTKGRR